MADAAARQLQYEYKAVSSDENKTLQNKVEKNESVDLFTLTSIPWHCL